MSSEKGPRYIYAQEHKLYYYYYHYVEHWENKNKKITTKQSEEYFFHQRCKNTSTNTVMVSRFWLAALIHRTIAWFSLFIGLFQRAKIPFPPAKFLILAGRMRHNAQQSDNYKNLGDWIFQVSIRDNCIFFSFIL